MAPVPGERREAQDVPHRHAAARVALQAVVEPDRRGPRPGVLAGERDDFLSGKPGDFRDFIRRVFLDALPEPLESERVFLDIVAVVEVLADDDVHHGERERGVGAR